MTTVAVHVHSDASSARGGKTVFEMVADEAFRHYVGVALASVLAEQTSCSPVDSSSSRRAGPPEAEAPAHSTPECGGATPRGCITQR